MTAIYENRVKEVNNKKLTKRICDKCETEIEKSGYTISRSFRLCFIEEKYIATGDRYRVGWRVNDLCDDCIKLLKQWLIENNVKLEERTIADAPNLGFNCTDDTENLL